MNDHFCVKNRRNIIILNDISKTWKFFTINRARDQESDEDGCDRGLAPDRVPQLKRMGIYEKKRKI